jgi:protein kinase A
LSRGYDKAVDFWALGVLIYEMMYSCTPFQADYTSKIFKLIVASEKYLHLGSNGSEDTISIIRGLLCPNPSFRLGNLSAGIEGIMNHHFFSDIDWEMIGSRQAPVPHVPILSNKEDSSLFGHYDEETDIPVYTGSEDYFKSF